MVSRGVSLDGALLRKHRQQWGLTQEKLSQLSDCDPRTIRNAEKGLRVDLATVESMAAALKIPVSWLIDERVSEACSSKPSSSSNLHKAIIQAQLQALRQNDATSLCSAYTRDVKVFLPERRLNSQSGLFMVDELGRNVIVGTAVRILAERLLARFKFLAIRESSFYSFDDKLLARLAIRIRNIESNVGLVLHAYVESHFVQSKIAGQIIIANFDNQT